MIYRYRHTSSTYKAGELSDRKQRIYNFLKNNSIGVLSTVTPNHDPHATVIYFSINEQFVVSFLTRHDTRKQDNISHNNHVMLTVFDCDTLTTAQIIGRAIKVTKPAEINKIAADTIGFPLSSSDDGPAPITKLKVGSYVAFTIDPAQIRLAVYGRPDTGDYNDLFESIESYELHD